MKKFTFRLEVLLKVKNTLEKEQKARLMEAQHRLRSEIQAMEALHEKQSLFTQDYQTEAASGMVADRMRVYGMYFDHLRDAMLEQAKRIEEARKVKDACMAKLLRTMKEIKALYKLRETQYALYLAEVASEEEKAIGDIVSFKAAVGK